MEKGKGIQFYHAKAGDDRAIVFARPYAAPPEVPDEQYPFWLSTGRVLEHWHTGTMTQRVKELHNAMPRAYVEFHPADAQELDIQDGDQIRVQSRRGSMVLPAWVRGRGMPARGRSLCALL